MSATNQPPARDVLLRHLGDPAIKDQVVTLLGVWAMKSQSGPDSESIGQCFQWAQKLPLKRKVCLPPAFALLAAPCLLLLIFVCMILLQPYPHKGLFVELMNPGLLPAASDPVSQPVIVQVLDNGTGEQPGVYVNSKVASWGRLDSALMDELKLHPKWIVYVEADAKVGWADVANAIDVAKGLQASGSVYKLEV